MKEYIKDMIKRQGLKISLVIIVIIILLNALLVIYNRNVIIESSEALSRVQTIKDRLTLLDDNIRLADIGVRAYLIRQTPSLLAPYNNAIRDYSENLDLLKANLAEAGFDVTKMAVARKAIDEYMLTCKLMVDLCDEGRVDEAIAIFEEDRGFAAWQRLIPFLQEAGTFVQNLQTQTRENYKRAIDVILFIQIFLILFAIPILIVAILKIVRDNNFKIKVFRLVDNSNSQYLFDDGKELEVRDEDAIIDKLVLNLKRAANFINKITLGQYNIEWEGMNQDNKELNKSNIAGELLMMRDQMSKAKKEDEIRIWTNEGLSKFAELIRKHQNDLHELSEKLIANIVEYLGAQQGGLFFVNEDEQKHKYLELMGCYAYQRKKFLEKKIEIGQGMVGQCYLEGETTYLTNIPEGYVEITSGLGQANPTTLLVVPLKINEEVAGVLEIASIKQFQAHQIEFIERLAESVASAIASVKINESTKWLLEQSQQQAEEMRAQEEEMRQNMEELQATQEQMHRKNEEVEALLSQASQNEESMKLQMEALEELQEEAARNMEDSEKEAASFKKMMIEILDQLPQRVFVKDAEGKLFLANKKVADFHGLPVDELIGKSDYDFVDKATADQWRAQELEIMKKGEARQIVEETVDNKKVVMESVKKAFKITSLHQEGLLGIQMDITEWVEMQRRLEEFEGKK
ncbi:MAG: GAF domain-containing protein [Cyclobacteriaceae bacterium]|nr:GAF domain-containing protein [Cyclobacteriaceae bacterium]